MENINLLKQLCETPGVSGHEEHIQKIVISELEEVVDEIRVDKLGNVIALKKATVSSQNKLTKVMIAAHMDEIGFLLKHIDKKGFLRFIPLGGFDPRTLIAQRVVIHGKRDVFGVIPSRPLWLSNKDEKDKVEIDDLYIDTGMPREEVARYLKVGDIITLEQDFKELNQGIVSARNFDDRLGVFIMLEAMKRMKESRADIYAVGTVQEELGVRGGIVSSFNVEPDIGIAIDGSLASDIPDVKEENRHCSLGHGAGIYIIDNRTVSDRKIVDFLIDLAEENDIKYQLNIGGGTDASAMQRSKKGARVCTIGPPIRYMHTVVQLSHKEDIESNINLLKLFLEHVHELQL